ncbi:hypothetical protein [Natrarchaeobaculum aegyptiacum]|uniref:Uncharacterized protein n=1 Tax=Natrarchaeobaculum aegyptiacum TaxID=745377 RepID=A0A2Z2I0T7_9EURY|nr:hypothetical protein [Natrarchaeobaculum aegyptiacum]ARS89858.1 hypothetical protein B1756_09000 [Natrarchaeobaculum aegyptiacum]
MSNDDSRGNQSPDRPDAPTRDHPTPELIHSHLEQVDALTSTLLAALEAPAPEDDAIDDLSDRERQAVRRHLLQIRAEASQVGLTVLGPEGAISYRPGDGSTANSTSDSSGHSPTDPADSSGHSPTDPADSSDHSPTDPADSSDHSPTDPADSSDHSPTNPADSLTDSSEPTRSGDDDE